MDDGLSCKGDQGYYFIRLCLRVYQYDLSPGDNRDRRVQLYLGVQSCRRLRGMDLAEYCRAQETGSTKLLCHCTRSAVYQYYVSRVW
jgi:hypothetical protein